MLTWQNFLSQSSIKASQDKYWYIFFFRLTPTATRKIADPDKANIFEYLITADVDKCIYICIHIYKNPVCETRLYC